VLDDTAAQM
jgi:hypothetical protein